MAEYRNYFLSFRVKYVNKYIIVKTRKTSLTIMFKGIFELFLVSKITNMPVYIQNTNFS